MAGNDRKFNELKQKYQTAVDAAAQHQARLENLNMQGDKLFLRAEAPTEEEAKNRIRDQIKSVDPQYPDLMADITVNESPKAQTAGTSATGGQQNTRTYTVKAGDSLSKISRELYGDPNRYEKIFEANRDKIADPNSIRAGQELTIPD